MVSMDTWTLRPGESTSRRSTPVSVPLIPTVNVWANGMVAIAFKSPWSVIRLVDNALGQRGPREHDRQQQTHSKREHATSHGVSPPLLDDDGGDSMASHPCLDRSTSMPERDGFAAGTEPRVFPARSSLL
jgi:hypothetical protein